MIKVKNKDTRKQFHGIETSHFILIFFAMVLKHVNNTTKDKNS